MITNSESGTNIQEIADGIYRINTPFTLASGNAFSFNQYLVLDDEPLLFHTGQRALFPLVSEALARVLPIEALRWLAVSHFEADECGALNEFLRAAPHAAPVCSRVAAMIAIGDFAERAPRPLGDGETLITGKRRMKWFDTPHVPHSWECGLMMDTESRTFFCGDLFTQPGRGETALTDSDILGPSESFRQPMDYYAHAPHTAATLERLAGEGPTTLACMHGSAWRGDGAQLLRELARAFAI
jgi:flavorubredoxin